MSMALYEKAMQAVPLLLISLFLDSRNSDDRSSESRSDRWERLQDRLFTILGVAAFMTSMFVVAGVAERGAVSSAIVIAALSGCISLLFAQIWRRFDRARPHLEEPDPDHPNPVRT